MDDGSLKKETRDDSVENQNKEHNVRKEALGPNTYRKR